jgi:hypothetical protein
MKKNNAKPGVSYLKSSYLDKPKPVTKKAAAKTDTNDEERGTVTKYKSLDDIPDFDDLNMNSSPQNNSQNNYQHHNSNSHQNGYNSQQNYQQNNSNFNENDEEDWGEEDLDNYHSNNSNNSNNYNGHNGYSSPPKNNHQNYQNNNNQGYSNNNSKVVNSLPVPAVRSIQVNQNHGAFRFSFICFVIFLSIIETWLCSLYISSCLFSFFVFILPSFTHILFNFSSFRSIL